MTHTDEPIYPDKEWGNSGSIGLTKREYFSAMAMQGLVSKGVPPDWHEREMKNSWVEWVAQMSCEMADNLISELNKEK